MLRLGLLVLFCLNSTLLGQITGGTRVDVDFGKKTSLRQFGGSNVDLVVSGKSMGVVDFEIIDNEHEVASAQTNINSVEVDDFSSTATVTGTNHVVFSPTISKRSIHLGSGFEYGKERREASLMYTSENGLRVFFLDALDVGQNGCALLIAPAATSSASSESVEDRLRRVEKMKRDGLISADEALKKRQEILSGL